jgi:hypothetical protein
MSIRLRQITLVANKLAPVIHDQKAVFGLELCYIDPGVAAVISGADHRRERL